MSNPGSRLTLPLALFGIFFLFSFSTSADEVLSLKHPEERYLPIETFQILEDPGGKLTVEQVSSESFDKQFKPVADRNNDFGGLDLGLTKSTWWIRFDVRAEDESARNHNWTMVFFNHRFVGDLAVYTPTTNNTEGTVADKWRVQKPKTHLSEQHGKNIFLDLPQIGTQPSRMYLRVQSDYYLYFTLSIESLPHYFSAVEDAIFMRGIFHGTLIIVAILNLLLFVFLKDKSALYYFGFVVCSALYFVGIGGDLTRFIKILGPSFYGYFYMFCMSAIMALAMLFTRSFLHTKKFVPKLDIGLRAYLLATVAVLVTLVIAGFHSSVGSTILHWAIIVLGTLSPVFIFSTGIVRLRQGFKPARLYLAAWGFFGLSVFIFSVPGFVQVNSWRVFQLGCAGNAFLITLAIVDRLRILRGEREQLSIEKHTVQSALSDSEQKFESIAELTTAHISILRNERFVYANPSFLEHVGMTLEELERSGESDVLTKEEIESNRAARAKAEEEGKNQFRYESRDAKGRWLEVTGSVVNLKGEEAVITTSLDLTERKLAEQQMFRSEKMASLGQIIAGVAHEINNPNNFIYFNLPILKKYIDAIRPFLDEVAVKNPDQKFLNMPYAFFIEDIYKLLDNMHHGSERITSIVKDLKNYVRSHDAEEKELVLIGEVVEQAMVLVGKQVRKLVTTFEVDVEPGLPSLRLNAGKIEQVIINLVINAGQAADKDDSWVHLSVSRPDENAPWVLVCVEDNGAGISEENQSKIFEPFFTTKGDESGTGLGLAISHQIITDHGGEMTVQSELGKGTTFTIRLPVDHQT